MRQAGARKNEIRQHSGWVIPLGFLAAILLLSGLFLGWYLRPGPKLAGGAYTGQSAVVDLHVRGVPFAVPANYLDGAAARGGGDVDSLALAALFPAMRGYTEADAALFHGNAPDTPVVRISLRADSVSLDGRARLARIYRPYIQGAGMAGPFGLTQYEFARNSGYERSELFAGESGTELLLFLCEKPSPDLPSPNCIAIDRPLAEGLSYSYRFKRAWLARWREMSGGVSGLIERLRKPD